MSRACQPKWMMELQVGDVLVSRTGTERIVRSISRCKKGTLNCVKFTIRHCSWTGRCYTVMNHNDLIFAGYRPKGARAKMRTKLDKRINACIANHNNRSVSCCDVRGIA